MKHVTAIQSAEIHWIWSVSHDDCGVNPQINVTDDFGSLVPVNVNQLLCSIAKESH